ncbi:2410_t:CDS:2 [Paraglomus brasilianum]|uniref:2410_t:CDS:1 n=1 Tax=Paraglomus brasilianum TaxID=144538 RepID=A0A9N8WKF0_9GLOM|nr:2410_t:CDS:2 [Paraglomus brasilianum]
MANIPSSTFAYGSTGQARSNNTQMPVDSEKRKSKSRRKVAEYDAKSEYEGSKDHLRVLMDQYGTKSKVVEDINRESTELQNKIMDLMRKAQMRGKPFSLTPSHTFTQTAGPCPTPSTPQTSSTIMEPAPSKQSEFSLTRTFFWLLWLPFQIAFGILRTVYRNLNWGTVLLTVAMMELTIVGIIWGIRRSHHNYLYVEPYEAEIHGTFGVESSSQFDMIMSVISMIRDFFAEVINGGRGFGSPEYVGYVPI